LKTSGLTYSWDASRPLGSRIVEMEGRITRRN